MNSTNFAEQVAEVLPCEYSDECYPMVGGGCSNACASCARLCGCQCHLRHTVLAALRQVWNAAVIECLEIQLGDDVDWRDSIDAMRALRIPEEP